MQSRIFSFITPVFSVMWSIRNHSNILICWSRNIFSKATCIAFKINTSSAHAFPGNPIHDMTVALLTAWSSLSYRNAMHLLFSSNTNKWTSIILIFKNGEYFTWSIKMNLLKIWKCTNDPSHRFSPIRSPTGLWEQNAEIWKSFRDLWITHNYSHAQSNKWKRKRALMRCRDVVVWCVCVESRKKKKQINKVCLLNWWPRASVARASLASHNLRAITHNQICRSLMCYIWACIALLCLSLSLSLWKQMQSVQTVKINTDDIKKSQRQAKNIYMCVYIVYNIIYLVM